MSNDLVKSIGIALLGGVLGLCGSAARDRLTMENREAGSMAQVGAISQRLDSVQTDIREIRQMLMDEQRRGRK